MHFFERTAWHCFQVVYTTIRTFNEKLIFPRAFFIGPDIAQVSD